MMKPKNDILILIVIFAVCILKPVAWGLRLAEAHMPGARPAPEFKLKPIILNDAGTEIKITIEDVAKYHNERTKEIRRRILKNEGKSDAEIDKIIEQEFRGADGKCPCISCAFRAVLLGIQKLWGKEIPQRNDIKIISHLPSPGSMQCFEYIVGKENFVLSIPEKKKRGEDIDIDNWNFLIIRQSTGDEFEVQVRDDVYPEGFFGLRKKVKVENSATKEELDKFRVMWEEVRDTFLTKADWELFEGIKEPFPIGGAIFFSLLITGAGSLLYVKNRKNRKSLKRLLKNPAISDYSD